jgi:signal transduction histidine kinase
MTQRPVICFAVLILLPTLLVGGLTAHLLGHERTRLENSRADLLESRVQLLAGEAAVLLQNLRQPYLNQLPAVQASTRRETLEKWMREDPLVRQAFHLAPSGELLLPAPGQARTEEERRFLQRYDALFSGRIPWTEPPEEVSEMEADPPSDAPSRSRRKDGRLSLPSFLGTSVKTPASTMAFADAGEAARAEWMSWFWEDQPHVLLWATDPETGERYGLEMETMALLAELIPRLPRPGDGLTLALVDSRGNVLHQIGPADLEKEWNMKRTVPLGAVLPHWEISLIDTQSDAGAAAILLPLLYAVIAVILLTSIGFGAVLLVREARRQKLDAERKTSFVSNVSHELKTPLTTIRMYAELLKEGRISSEEKKAGYLDTIVEESGRLGRLISNVLDFSRLEQATKHYTRSTFDLNELLQEIQSRQAHRVQESGMALNLTLPDGVTELESDRDAVEQTLLNLIDNAMKYAAEGKVIDLTLDRSPTDARIQVRDRGRGIQRPHREKIFEKFYRIDDSLTAASGGSGLGLAISRKMIRELGGDLILEPESPGACFTLRLPRSQPEAA